MQNKLKYLKYIYESNFFKTDYYNNRIIIIYVTADVTICTYRKLFPGYATTSVCRGNTSSLLFESVYVPTI